MDIGCAYAIRPDWPKFRWLHQACERLGHTVRHVNPREGIEPLRAALSECELCLFAHKSVGGRWPNIRSAIRVRERCPVVYIWFDLVATTPGVHMRHQPMFGIWKEQFLAYDVVLVKERGLLDEYRELGVNAHWWDQGCPSDYPETTPGERWDLLVWGQWNSEYRDRIRSARAVADAGFKVGWAGTRPPGGKIEHLAWTHPDRLPDLASGARCVLCSDRRNDLDGFRSDRFWLAMGMGACVVCRSSPGLPDGPYLKYHNAEECVNAVRWVTENPNEAAWMGKMAREWVMKEHTLEHRAAEAIRIARTAMETAGST